VQEIRRELRRPSATSPATARRQMAHGVAQRQLLPGVEHRESRNLNNQAENSHRPTRRREPQMQRFKSSRHAQDFLSAHSFIYGRFRPRRHLLPAPAYHEIRRTPSMSGGRKRESEKPHNWHDRRPSPSRRPRQVNVTMPSRRPRSHLPGLGWPDARRDPETSLPTSTSLSRWWSVPYETPT
jgi:hypothetical protein